MEMAEMMINSQIGIVTATSSIYETEAWGRENQPAFLNNALKCNSSQSPDKMLQTIHLIEAKMGRKRIGKWLPRVIDIDILFYGDQIIKKHNLNIPHPEISNRNFVLAPLMELCPEMVHPELNRTISELFRDSKDTYKVVKIKAD